MAHELIRQNHIVSGCARSHDAIVQLKTQLGHPHLFSVVDVTQANQVAAWCEETLATMGPPDLLINNAAIINHNAKLWEVPHEEFSRVVDININGVFNVTKSFLPSMVEVGAGVVVNFSSGWGRSVSADVAPYCATKWAIEGMTKALAEELPGGMAAVPFSPGVVNTEMLQTCWSSGANSCIGPEEWAKSNVPFLLALGPSDNGQSLTAR